MIHQLLTDLASLLGPALSAVGVTSVQAGQPPANTPGVGLIANTLDVNRQASDESSSQPRPQARRQVFAVADYGSGPYPFEQTALEGSVLAWLVTNPDERRVLLAKGADFEMNDPNDALNLDDELDLSKAVSLIVEYSFVGVFTVREFEQEFYLQALGSDPEEAEKLGALCAAVLLTNHDSILETFNAQAGYAAAGYGLTPVLSQIQWVHGAALPGGGESAYYRLNFVAKGRIRMAKSDPGAYGIIEEIRSPGAELKGDQRVGIEPELG